MKRSLSNLSQNFPMLVELNFEKLIQNLEQYSSKTDSRYSDLINQYRNSDTFAEVRAGLSTLESIQKNKELIGDIIEPLFPKALGLNEIKMATIPFTDIFFYNSPRFDNLLRAAGPNFKFDLRNFNKDNNYIFGCSLILNFYYKYKIDFKRPFFVDIPDIDGKTKSYRAVLNGDFMNVLPTEKAVPITKEDVALLIDNYHNVDLWKEKFPPHSYIFKGFGITNLYDATLDEAISNIKLNLLTRTDSSFEQIEENIRTLYGIDEIDLGVTIYKEKTKTFEQIPSIESRTLMLGQESDSHADEIFCAHLASEVLIKHRITAISDLEVYGRNNNYNVFYKNLRSRGYNSYTCAPLLDGDRVMGIIELGSSVNQFLNSINANKLEDVVPYLSIVVKQQQENYKDKLEVIIQDECTSIHPTVAWKFLEEAEAFYKASTSSKEAIFKEIVFENVFPLYGQCDIRGSSDARNIAIKNDLILQLEAAEKIILSAKAQNDLIIYKELVYQIDQYKADLEAGLAAGVDQQILEFLKADIYPVFSHLKAVDSKLNQEIEAYNALLNDDLKMVYEHRKNYDETVTKINKHLSSYLDMRAAEAQLMFPHFFERFKTDGVEYNMYIGQSLVKDKKFDPIYLHNLKLWQLSTMCELENQFALLQPHLDTPLEIASLILAYSTPLSIRFRMDEKQFDVDGAYNARYEIVKKRIDKAYIKGTTERLTQPGMLAIVYSQQSERLEYDKYAKYLKALGYITGDTEYHILEDLQGITGLRAMRFRVKYQPQDKLVNESAAESLTQVPSV